MKCKANRVEAERERDQKGGEEGELEFEAEFASAREEGRGGGIARRLVKHRLNHGSRILLLSGRRVFLLG